MSPPELSGNTPVPDIVCPVKIGLFHAGRNQLDLSVTDSLCRRLYELVHFHKPLLLDHGLNGGLTSVMGSYIMGIILNAD